MNAELWTQRVSESAAPAYPCPHCETGILLLQKGTFARHVTNESNKNQPEHGYVPELMEYTFACWLKCAAPKCGEMVAVVGKGHDEPTWDDEQGMDWEECFVPKFAWPMPPIFAIPKACPEPVAREIHASFQAFWSDRSAAASRLRVAIERLLDEIGIRRRRVTAKKKIEELTLHQRIELMAKTSPEVGTSLMAIKWLGNTGSHDGSVGAKDVLDAYEIFDPTLDTILGERAKRVSKLAKQLTKKHVRRRKR